jgi:hypothetical protein
MWKRTAVLATKKNVVPTEGTGSHWIAGNGNTRRFPDLLLFSEEFFDGARFVDFRRHIQKTRTISPLTLPISILNLILCQNLRSLSS